MVTARMSLGVIDIEDPNYLVHSFTMLAPVCESVEKRIQLQR